MLIKLKKRSCKKKDSCNYSLENKLINKFN